MALSYKGVSGRLLVLLLLQSREFLDIEVVSRKLTNQTHQQLFCTRAVLRAQGRHRQQKASIRAQVPAVRRRQLQLLDSYLRIGLRTAEMENPPNRRGLQAQQIILRADRKVRIGVF